MNFCHTFYLIHKMSKHMKTTFETVDEILDFAINREQESIVLYERLANEARTPQMKSIFLQFADEERGHKQRLMNIKSSGQFKVSPTQQITDLKIADYLVDIREEDGLTYQAALILAMKKEKVAFKLYMDLAERTDDLLLKSLFENLAQEEAKHKLRFELEYDDLMRDN